MKDLPALPTLGIVLIQAPRRMRRETMTTLTFHLALLGPVRILDGGNSFDGLKLARELRRQTRSYHTCLQRVTVARAFTCYQMASLLEVSLMEYGGPTLILELLSTFADENVPFSERQHLLHTCLPHLKRRSQIGPVFISAELFDDPLAILLASWVDHLWQLEESVPVAIQGRLF